MKHALFVAGGMCVTVNAGAAHSLSGVFYYTIGRDLIWALLLGNLDTVLSSACPILDGTSGYQVKGTLFCTVWVFASVCE